MKLSDCEHGSIVKVGSHIYRLYRLASFRQMLGAMMRFARLQPCAKVNPSTKKESEYWWDDHNEKSQLHDWSDECELVDDSNTAVAGEVWVLQY